MVILYLMPLHPLFYPVEKLVVGYIFEVLIPAVFLRWGGPLFRFMIWDLFHMLSEQFLCPLNCISVSDRLLRR